MIKFLLVLLTLCMLVTCFNIQALRDTYAPEPDPLEAIIINAIEQQKEVNYGATSESQ